MVGERTRRRPRTTHARYARRVWSTAAPPDGSQLGRLVRAHREARGLTQAEFAAHLAMSQPQLSRIENGTRRVRDVDELRRLARLLDVSPAELGVLPDRSADAVPDGSGVSAGPGPARESQQRWRAVRQRLAADRIGLGLRAAGLYPELPTVHGTPALAGPGWVPDVPIDLDAVALTWRPDAPPLAINGGHPATAAVRPLSARGGRYDRYSRAVRDLDRPRLLENRPGYRLLDVRNEPGGFTLDFGYTTYFETLDVSEALGHELAGVGAGPLRDALGSPFDLALRPVMPSITTVTIRRDPAGDHRVYLMRRDGQAVAVCGGLVNAVPGGQFQPASLAPSAQSADFSLWRSIQREFAEEVLGMPEHDGNSIEPVDYATEPFRSFDEARTEGRFRMHLLGVVVEPVAFWVDILTVAVIDAPVFDRLFADMVSANDESTLVSAVPGDPRAGVPFAPDTQRQLGGVNVAPLTSACLALAFHHRDLLLG